MLRLSESEPVNCPIFTKELDYSRFLPRNLSYCEEGCWDSFSATANFVKNPTYRLNTFEHYPSYRIDSLTISVDQNMTDMQSASVDCVADSLDGLVISKPSECVRQNSNSDAGESEEGVFFNMMDDLDSEGSETVSAVSMCSDDFAVDSINSPDEDDQAMKEKLEAEFSEADQKVNLSVAAGQLFDPPAEPITITERVSGTANTEVVSKSQPNPNLELSLVPRRQDPTCLKINISDAASIANVDSEKSIYDMIDSDSPLYEDREFNFTKTELRKSTSLKTNKTPPGTPHRKKVVRFADAMGLDLESVRHILNMDSPPKIPQSAMKDLQVGLVEDRKSLGSVYLAVTFSQPGASFLFIRKVLDHKVCLENALVNDLTITGFVRVSNIGFHKNVRVRYTINNWESFYDIAASYVQNSCDGPTDRFSFSIVAPSNFVIGSKLQFAVSYTVNGECYWDSNDGKNYVFECFAKTVPTENDTSWMHFL